MNTEELISSIWNSGEWHFIWDWNRLKARFCFDCFAWMMMEEEILQCSRQLIFYGIDILRTRRSEITKQCQKWMQNKPVYVQEKCTWGYLFFNFWSTTFTRLLSNCIGSDCMNEVNESLVFLLYAIKRFCYTPVSKTHCITWQPLLFHQALVQPGLNLFNATINMQEMVPCCCEICSIPTAIVPCCSIRP